MRNSKKSQQEIIVTVLLVLIALAAVAVVATFVVRNVKTGTTAAEEKGKCINAQLALSDIKNGALAIGITRTGSSDTDVTAVAATILNNGIAYPTTVALASPGTSGFLTVAAVTTGQKIEAFATLTLTNGKTVACDVSSTKTVIA